MDNVNWLRVQASFGGHKDYVKLLHCANEIERLREALHYILMHCKTASPPNAKALILFANNALKEGE